MRWKRLNLGVGVSFGSDCVSGVGDCAAGVFGAGVGSGFGVYMIFGLGRRFRRHGSGLTGVGSGDGDDGEDDDEDEGDDECGVCGVRCV